MANDLENATIDDGDTDQQTRRRFLRRGAITAAIAAASGAAMAGRAADNDPITVGNTFSNNNPGGETVLTGSTSATKSILAVTQTGVNGGTNAIKATHTGNVGSAVGLLGEANGSSGGYGVVGQFNGATGSVDAAGVFGSTSSLNAIGVKAASVQNASLLLFENTVTTMPPTVDTWTKGSFVVNGSAVWFCYLGGAGSNSKWVKLSSTLVTLVLPFRIYDSRVGQGNPSGAPQGVLVQGAGPRVINCAPAIPTGVPARTFLFNVTLANTVGAVGSVIVWANGQVQPNSASITWTGNGVVVGNAVTSACDPSLNIQIECTTGASTHVIIDTIGYYL